MLHINTESNFKLFNSMQFSENGIKDEIFWNIY